MGYLSKSMRFATLGDQPNWEGQTRIKSGHLGHARRSLLL